MNIITKIRESYLTRGLAMTLALNMLFELIWPTTAMALTTGPSQPEVQSFEPVETTDMVNLFTGDFTYNIPLMNVPGPNGGYPINLAYHGGISMDQEASWVGLGWNISAGAINRSVRGVPDDFDGDEVKVTQDIKDNWTAGLGVSGKLESFGAQNNLTPGGGVQIYYNNYKGFGYALNGGLQIGKNSPSFNVGLSLDPEDGIGVNAQMSLSEIYEEKIKGVYSLGLGFNSKRGLDLSTGTQFSKVELYKKHSTLYTSGDESSFQVQMTEVDYSEYSQNKDLPSRSYRGIDKGSGALFSGRISYVDVLQSSSVGASQSIGFASSVHSPINSMPMNNYRTSISVGTGGSILGQMPKAWWSGFFDNQTLRDKGKEVAQPTFGYENMNNDMEFGDFSRDKDGNVMKTSSNLASPQLTYDYYNIQGQGIGGTFRPFRSEVGRVYDPTVRSFTLGASINVDGGHDKIGWGGGVTTGYSTQKAWKENNGADHLQFSETNDLWEGKVGTYKKKEDVYYQIHGEQTTKSITELNHIGGEDAYGPALFGNGVTGNYKTEATQITNERDQSVRIKKNNVVTTIKNKEVLNFHIDSNPLQSDYGLAGDDYLHEFEVFYYDWSEELGPDYSEDPTNYLDRTVRSGHNIENHNAGYKVLDDNGATYFYALPAYNLKQWETIFSINAADDNDPDDYVEAGQQGDQIYQAKESVVPLPFEKDHNGNIVATDSIYYKHSNTHKYYSKRETPAYAHAYELTSIVGADYIDITNDGLSDDDKGHWVKFDYTKYSDDYEWRAPYAGCLYNPNKASTLEDDMGSFQAGVKEQWYLSRIETATHIAIFEFSERNDNVESGGYLNQESNTDSETRGDRSGLKIDRIKLYKKDDYENNSNPEAIQVVHFEYDYSLCPGVPNNNPGLQNNDSATENQGGKLTLKKVWFTTKDNDRGALNPYEFIYDVNKPYSTVNYDRWGNHKPLETGVDVQQANDYNQNLPYVHQYYQGYIDVNGAYVEAEGNKQQFKDLKDENAAAWSLTTIKLPSGGDITVDYESDDYAYVQDERATQMTYITKVNDNNNTADNELYEPGATSNDFNDPTQRRVYFKLEQPIADLGTDPTDLNDYATQVFNDYVQDIIVDEGGKRNLYFKSYFTLKGTAEDFVSGYLPLEDNLSSAYNSNTIYHYGVDLAQTAMIDGVLCYTHGFVTVECTKRKSNGNCYKDFHPMSLVAWQHIRSNAPEILSDSGADFGADELTAGSSSKQKAKKVSNLVGFVPELIQMFSGYRRFCFNKEMARKLDLNKSMIKLTSPDKIKYGGGVRVKKIEMTDNWNSFEGTESSEIYGQVYEYTTSELVDGEEIVYSSGVAQYEPMIGGDENAMKYPRFYPGKIPTKTNDNLFYEYPINESFMPSPTVGYSKVRVTSLNTNNQITKALDQNQQIDAGRGVTGVTEYNFYTAKDFPVITEQTEIKKKSFNVPIIIPFVATYTRNKLAATQGYKIELNDMHGKLESLATYGLDENFHVKKDPISKTTYTYSSEVFSHNGKICKRLQNELPTLSVDPSTKQYIEEDRLIGVEYEFFTDQRHNKSATSSFTFNNNVDVVTIPVGPVTIPFPSFWGTLSSFKNDLRLHVTNKVIHKSGVLIEVENKNESYVSKSQNMAFDKETGRTMLSVTTNNFNDPIYSLRHPAHLEYEGMGKASENINMEFETTIYVASSTLKTFYADIPNEIIDEMVPGDEMIMHVPNNPDPEPEDPIDREGLNLKATFISKNYETNSSSNAIIYVDQFSKNFLGQSSLTAFFKIYRSGRRNLYSTDAGGVSLKVNPLGTNGQTAVAKTYLDHLGNNFNEDVIIFNEVLNVSATTFRDNWETENGDNENPYATGELGVWKPYKSYVYDGERVQDKLVGIDVQNDGVMNNVPMFNWQLNDFEKYEENWHYGSEITRYNQYGYELENVDQLGIYSTALYGYNHAFVTAVGSNGKYEEIGVEDFERFTTAVGDDLPEVMSQENNLNFYEAAPTNVSVRHQDVFNIVGGSISNGIAEIYVNVPYDLNYWSDPTLKVDVALNGDRTVGSKDFRMLRVTPTNINPYNDLTKFQFEVRPEVANSVLTYLPDLLAVSGKVTTYRTKNNIAQYSNVGVTISDQEAHTGEHSLSLTGMAAFKHARLDLIENKDYTLSFWMKKENSDVPFYDVSSLIEVDDVESSIVNLVSEIRAGKIIEGWQKVEVDFTPQTSGNIIRTRFLDQGEIIYLDDVRIAPKIGGVMTYVYDTETLRLSATLNANNYATFYFYDSEGNLYLTKQETEEGIFTISENHSYVKPRTTN